ncbi:acetamidase [Mucilaginibacter sp. PPCGB 2223]|uniref:acetamidase/formamidase family protein n=1 Tax=Mucilaginibacter sp. PPCGB 2223 TaxID=1886027 RepID=UPI00082571D0|nr:acetamidase/formamidase family protein [Mucilaginibacter sp. PPCGB 2223]OCX51245.1 acetamidase [Mucilaginibacter sp. PPCGB 2223]
MNQLTGNENPRRNFLKTAAKGSAVVLSLSGIAARAVAADEILNNNPVPPAIKPDHVVRSIPENMVWGYYGADVPPVAKVKDGDIVEIQTINTTGITRRDPEAFFKENNLPIDEQAQDIIAIYKNVKPEPSGLTGHMLTGPVYIEGAEPGDTLEVRILDVIPRSGYGVNAVWPKGGDLPDAVTTRQNFVYKYDTKKHTASFKPGVEIPIKPFMGVMAVSPAPEKGRVSSIPPGPYGGNMDLKHLVKGTTLYLPVSAKGALFTTGDCHAGQGNGEISGVAIEASLTLIVKFIVRKDMHITHVRAETPTHFIALGLDPDLATAMKNAATQATSFIRDELGFTFNEALSICSTGVDFEVTQVVDKTLGVHAMIPKSIFTNKKFEYWKV